MLQLDYDHFQVWDDVNPLGLGAEYDELPRGRVMFNTYTNKFVVVTSTVLANDPSFQSAIRSFYGLPQTAVFESDEHYG